MADLILQDDQGDIFNANAYVDVPWFLTYVTSKNELYVQYDNSVPPIPTFFADRGFTTPSGGYSVDQVSAAIIAASYYLDIRWNFIGWRRYSNQPTAWPRWDAVDINDRYLKGIPLAVQQATCEYALVYLIQGYLVSNPVRSPTGQDVKEYTRKLGPLEQQWIFNSSFRMPRYPQADGILKTWGLIMAGGQTVRA